MSFDFMSAFMFYFGLLLALLGLIITTINSDFAWYRSVSHGILVALLFVFMTAGIMLLIAFVELMLYGRHDLSHQPHNWARRLMFKLEK